MKAIYALSVLAAAASAISFKADPFWKSYKAAFGKTYESEVEEARRYEVFNQNMQKAAEFNAQETMAEYGMTVVSDRFPEELFSSSELEDLSSLETLPASDDLALPASFDSRNRGWIPTVRNQGQCGSCWAFSTAATVSGSYAKAHGVSAPILSEQQIVDCDSSNSGCSGGLAARALKYCKKGVMLNSDYSYTARAGTCKFVSSKVKAKVKDVYSIGSSVSAMQNAVYNYGIISVRVNANKLQSYNSGIMDASNCPASPNHAVNVVGWGYTGSTKYWIVRNSWGSYWGESGYFRLVSGSNACGVEGWPVAVTVY